MGFGSGVDFQSAKSGISGRKSGGLEIHPTAKPAFLYVILCALCDISG